MQTINIKVDGMSFFTERLYVRRDTDINCECGVDLMSPERPANAIPEGYTHVCARCSGLVTWEQNDDYNRYFGFSGYDDIPDHDDIDYELDDPEF